MRTRALLAFALVACSAPRPHPPRGEVVLRFQGKVENGPFLFGRDDLPNLPKRAFTALSPYTGEEARYEGISVSALLTDAMEIAQDADTAVVRGRDGYAVAVPVAALRQLKPALAAAPTGSQRGSHEGSSLVLAWPNQDYPGFDSDPRARWWWVQGVRTVDLQSWLRTYGRALRVPEGASDDARKGADVVSASCMACHQVRGVGGTRGPALDRVGSRRDAMLSGARAQEHLAKVAGGAPAAMLRPGAGAQVAAFLDAIALVAPEPEEEPPAEGPPAPLPPPLPLGPQR